MDEIIDLIRPAGHYEMEMVAHYFESVNADVGQKESNECHNVHRCLELIVIVKQHRIVFLRADVKATPCFHEPEQAHVLLSRKVFLFHISFS